MRCTLQASKRIDIRVQPINGDPNLCLWAPDALTLPATNLLAQPTDIRVQPVSGAPSMSFTPRRADVIQVGGARHVPGVR